jgi:hypothetical protein
LWHTGVTDLAPVPVPSPLRPALALGVSWRATSVACSAPDLGACSSPCLSQEAAQKEDEAARLASEKRELSQQVRLSPLCCSYASC